MKQTKRNPHIMEVIIYGGTTKIKFPLICTLCSIPPKILLSVMRSFVVVLNYDQYSVKSSWRGWAGRPVRAWCHGLGERQECLGPEWWSHRVIRKWEIKLMGFSDGVIVGFEFVTEFRCCMWAFAWVNKSLCHLLIWGHMRGRCWRKA